MNSGFIQKSSHCLSSIKPYVMQPLLWYGREIGKVFAKLPQQEKASAIAWRLLRASVYIAAPLAIVGAFGIAVHRYVTKAAPNTKPAPSNGHAQSPDRVVMANVVKDLVEFPEQQKNALKINENLDALDGNVRALPESANAVELRAAAQELRRCFSCVFPLESWQWIPSETKPPALVRDSIVQWMREHLASDEELRRHIDVAIEDYYQMQCEENLTEPPRLTREKYIDEIVEKSDLCSLAELYALSQLHNITIKVERNIDGHVVRGYDSLLAPHEPQAVHTVSIAHHRAFILTQCQRKMAFLHGAYNTIFSKPLSSQDQLQALLRNIQEEEPLFGKLPKESLFVRKFDELKDCVTKLVQRCNSSSILSIDEWWRKESPRIEKDGVIRSPGDGNCLFHSVSRALQLAEQPLRARGLWAEEMRGDAQQLRAMCVKWMRDNYDTDQELQEKVKLSIEDNVADGLIAADASPEAYFALFERNGYNRFWGSYAEIYTLSQMFQLTIAIRRMINGHLTGEHDPVFGPREHPLAPAILQFVNETNPNAFPNHYNLIVE